MNRNDQNFVRWHGQKKNLPSRFRGQIGHDFHDFWWSFFSKVRVDLKSCLSIIVETSIIQYSGTYIFVQNKSFFFTQQYFTDIHKMVSSHPFYSNRRHWISARNLINLGCPSVRSTNCIQPRIVRDPRALRKTPIVTENCLKFNGF